MKKKILFLAIFIIVLFIGGVAVYYFTESSKGVITYAETEAKYKTYTEEAPSDGSLPTDHNSYDNIAYLLWKIEHTEHYSSTTRGSAVSVGQSQTIYNHRVINGDEQLVDTVSGGVVTLGKQKYFKDGKVLIRDYISQDGDDITWKTEEPECITYHGYMMRYGWLPSQATAYIICKDTILDISEVEVLDNGLYKIHLSLNPNRDYAPFWYKREITTNSSSLIEPVFSSIEIDYIFDANWVTYEVRTQETYEVKPKVAPIKVDCNTDIVEKFDYENYEFSKDAMDFFNQYGHLVPVDGEVDVLPVEEETPLSYITGALLGSEGAKKFKLSLKIQDQVVEGYLGLDISDLNNIVVELELGDLYFKYANDTAYLSYGNVYVKGNISEIMDILNPLIEQITLINPSTNTSLDITSSLDLNTIMNDINSATIVENDSHITLYLSLHLLDFELPLVFEIEKVKDGYEMVSISSNLNIMEMPLEISLIQDSNLNSPKIDESLFCDLKNIDFIIQDITHILSSKKLSLNLNTCIQDYKLVGTVLLDFNQDLKALANITVLKNEEVIADDLEIIYSEQMLYIQFKDYKFKISIEQLSDLLDGKMDISMPSIETKDIITTILSLDLKSILNGLTINQNEIILSLELPEFGLVYSKISDTEQGFDISIDAYDIFLSINANTTEDIVIESDYVDLSNYLDNIAYLLDIIMKKSFRLNISSKINLNEETINLVGYLDFILKNEKYQMNSSLTIGYQDMTVDLKVIMIDQKLYAQVLGQTILLHLNTISETIKTILTELNIEVSKPNLDLNDFTISENRIDLGKIWIELGLKEAHIEVTDVVQIDLSITEITEYEIETPKETFTDVELLELVDYIKDVLSIVENQKVYVSFSGAYEEYQLEGVAYLEWKETLKGKVEFSINGKKIEVYYLENNIYIGYEQLKGFISLDKIKDLMSSNMEGMTLPEVDKNILEIVEELLNDITISENQIVSIINIENLPQIILTIIDQENGFDIKLNQYDIKLKIDTSKELDLNIQKEKYVDLNNCIDIVSYLLDILFKESLSLTFSGNVKDLSWEGTIDFVLNDKNQYDIYGEVEVIYNDMILPIKLWMVQGELYLSILDNVIGISTEELNYLIEKVLSEFELPAVSVDGTILDDLTILKDSISLSLGTLFLELNDGLNGKITSDLFNLDFNLQANSLKEIIIPQITITYDDLMTILDDVFFVKNMIGEYSILLDISSGKVTYNSIELEFNGTIDFVLNDENGYDIKVLLVLSSFGYDTSLELIWKNHILYMTVLGQTIRLTQDELIDLISKQNVSLANEKNFDLSLIELVLSSNQIDLNLEQMLDFVLAIIIHFEKIEDSLNVDLDISYENLNFNASMSLSKSELADVLVPTENMMDYSDINEWLEQIDYLVKLIQNEAIHIDLESTSIKLDSDQEVIVQGSFDVLLQNDSYALAGWIDLDGFGMTLRVDITLMDDTIYVSMLGQTIVLKISEIDSFIQDIMSILEPLMNSTMSLTRKITFNLDDLNLKMDANQLEVTLDSLVGDLCRVALVIDVLMQEEEQWLDLILNIDYSSLSISNIHLKISPSMISSIVAPNATITKDDILKICEYVVLAYQMKDQTEFGFVIDTDIIKNGVVVAHIEGEISLRLLLETNEFDAKIDLFVDEFNANGDSTAWHQVHLNVISATTMNEISSTISEAMLIGTYGNYAADQEQVIKIKSTYQGIKHLIQSIMSLLNIDVNSIEIAPSNMNLNHLLASLMVDDQALNIGIYANSLFNGIDFNEVIDLNISKDENRITGLNINNLYVSYTNEFNFMKLDHLSVDLINPAELAIEFALPTDLDSYYDISNTAYLFEALYHNALERDFEITGTVELQALSIIKKDVDVLIQVHVEENGEPTIYARLDIPSVWPLLSQKKLHIYYADQYVYIYREDSTAKDSKKIKIHYETFISNIVYYLLDFGMGMPDLVLNEINDSNAKKKGYVNAADCVNQVAFSENHFQIGLNLGEITDNSNLGNLNFTIESALVSQDNELVPMITKITEFSFNMVSVIKLTLKKNTELTLSNIVEEDGMLVVSEMDFSSIYQYISDYSYDEDIEYSYNGKNWVAGNMVSHSAIFINEYANEQITREYYKNDLVEFPVYDVINANEEYYRFEGWYYDATFQNNVDGPYYMNNRNATFYAKFVLVTSDYVVSSPYGTTEYQLHTYEDQSLETLFKEYQDKVVTVGDQTWRFTRFELLKDDEWFLFDEQTAMIGTYILRACWEEVYYTAYILETNEIIKLSSLSDEIVSNNAFIKSNDIYYGYLNNTLTQSILLNEYISMFDEDNQISIYSLDDISLLRLIEFDFTEVDSIYQNKSYNAIASLPNDDISTYLPNGSTEQFEINAWIYQENYYSANAVSNILENVTIKPYITSKIEFFDFDGNVMTSYQSDSSRENLITPMYVNNILITKIGTEVFKDDSYVVTVVLSEGIVGIEEHAFQNAMALKNVYLPTTLTMIASEAFLFDFGSDFEKCRNEHASLLRLYYIDEQQNNTFGDLNACYPASAKKQIFHYGKKETHVFWSADLRDTFQKAMNGNNLIEISYAIINH